jgi:hypothetical protein
MIRIVCPGCHSPLSSAELEQATIGGYLSLVCPECSMVLLTEPADEVLIQQQEETPAHA